MRRRNSNGSDDTANTPETASNSPVVMLKDNSERWKKWWTRFYSTVLMIGGFVLLIWAGHLALVCFVFVLQLWSFNEIMSIRAAQYEKGKEQTDLDRELVPVHKLLDFWFFVSALYYVNAKTFFARFPGIFHNGGNLEFLMKHHGFVGFSLFCIGFVFFVLTLEKGKYRRQFKQFSWIIVTMFLVVMAGSFHVSNIFHGLFWFLLPAALVICNDVMAFVWGFHFGKTPLIKLSPRKTWEGFIGAFFSTIIFAFFAASFLAQWNYMVCPSVDLFSIDPCIRSRVFTLQTYSLPSEISSVAALLGLEWSTVDLYPCQIDAVIMAIFASLIAPFGGFFASGFKRAFKIKDFGDSIPGHGGITDRMDCQFVMGAFASVYFVNFVQSTRISDVLGAIILLSKDDQVALYEKLGQLLAEQGLL